MKILRRGGAWLSSTDLKNKKLNFCKFFKFVKNGAKITPNGLWISAAAANALFQHQTGAKGLTADGRDAKGFIGGR